MFGPQILLTITEAEGKIAIEFLENWSVEDALWLVCKCVRNSDSSFQLYLRTLAALADAHDEAFLVTRVADQDGVQPTDIYSALELWLGAWP